MRDIDIIRQANREHQSELRAERKRLGVCMRCGKRKADTNYTCCGICRKKGRETLRIRTSNWRTKGLCVRCGKHKSVKPHVLCNNCLLGNKTPQRRRYRNMGLAMYKQKLRDEVFQAYGGYRCKCCGETQRMFLTIDHIKNDGAEHRKKLGGMGFYLYQWLRKKKFPKGYQVMCMNCNFGKHRNGGICPHQQEKQ